MEIDITHSELDSSTIAAITIDKGFSHIPAAVYLDDNDEQELKIFQSSYFLLPPDEKGGQRFRTRKPLNLFGGELLAVDDGGYVQSPEYNSDLGGVVRNIPLMDEKVFSLGVLQKVIWKDIAIAREMNILPFEEKIKIGLHQVRYNPTKGNTSYSSPPGLHKDDEDIVFIHIVNVSSNLVGGENIICDSAFPKINKNGLPPFLAHINLTEPMEAICVTKKYFHQVFPMSVSSGKSAYRDILLVTFEKEKSKS